MLLFWWIFLLHPIKLQFTELTFTFLIAGKVTSNSFFTNLHTSLDPAFKPAFYSNNITDLYNGNETAFQMAQSVCGDVDNNYACYFDFAVTFDSGLAESTKDYKDNLTAQITALGMSQENNILYWMQCTPS